MVRRHFLFLSSVTPTRNVESGPGCDSPAELFWGPCWTPNAGSTFDNFCIGVWTADFSEVAVPDVGEPPWRCRVCFALENMSLAARETPLVLLCLDAPASLFLRSEGVDVLPDRFSRPGVSSVDELAFFCAPVGTGASMAVASSSFPGELPNILFNRPPWVEKLRRLLPARLKRSTFEGRAKRTVADETGQLEGCKIRERGAVRVEARVCGKWPNISCSFATLKGVVSR